MFGRLPAILSFVVVLTILGASIAYAEQTVKVTFTEFKFDAATYTVPAGEKITFDMANAGRFPHDIRIEGQGVTFEAIPANGNVATGQSASASFTFNTPGTYQMWCPVGTHRAQGMEATFIVTAAGAPATAAPAAAAPAAAPAPSAVAPATLPRTGGPALPVGMAVIAGGLVAGLGWLSRRRGTAD
jgi:plastocyanin